MINLSGKQIMLITAAVVSALMLATTQLSDLFGQDLAKRIVSAAALTNMVLSSVVAALSDQKSLVTDVQAMPGVEKITVNNQASQVLAKLASDSSQSKIVPVQGSSEAVKDIATRTGA